MSLTSNTAICYCFVSDKKYLPLAKAAWEEYMDSVPPTIYVAIPALPRGAMVEWQVILNAPLPVTNDDDDDDDDEEELRKAADKMKAIKLQEPAGNSIT